MKWIDSHAHLDLDAFDADRDEVVRRAQAAGVRMLLCPVDAVSREGLSKANGLREKYPGFVRMAAGVHPHQGKEFGDEHLVLLKRLASDHEIVALGEIGLDFHYNFSAPEEQRRAFRAQLGFAREIGLPAIIHSRLAISEVMAAVREERLSRGGVLHCYTEDLDSAFRMLDLGFFISFSGILTFPKAGNLRKVASEIPLGRLLVETDAPYLAPVPHRHVKRNEPAFVVETARVLAGLKKIPLEELAEATTRNFFRLFGPSPA